MTFVASAKPVPLKYTENEDWDVFSVFYIFFKLMVYLLLKRNSITSTALLDRDVIKKTKGGYIQRETILPTTQQRLAAFITNQIIESPVAISTRLLM